MTYKIINSGSDGNATVLEDMILLDCGVSYKKIKPYVDKLKIVLLTHIHQDHFNKTTIKRIAENRPTIRFGCCEWLVKDLIDCGVDKRNIDVYEIGTKFNYGVFSLIPVQLYHDVLQCGYRIFISDKKIIYMTDTKTLEGIKAEGYDLYLIEANYRNEEELHERAENEYYEERVKNTHLSEEEATEWLLKNMNENSNYEFMHRHKERNKNVR